MGFAVQKTIDNLGRLVIPKNLRDYYCINLNDKVTLIPTEDGILITKCIGDNVKMKPVIKKMTEKT